MRKSAHKVARPAHRYMAAVSPDRGPYVAVWDLSRADALVYCAQRGDRFVGLHKTADQANEALRPAPTQEEQAEVLIGGLVASVVATRRVA